MTKVEISQRLNALTGGDPSEMFCARVYRSHGIGWRVLEIIINLGFYPFTRSMRHCANCYFHKETS